MLKQDEALDRVFHALADSSRRNMVERLSNDLELEPRWWRDTLRARTVVAPGVAAIDLGLRVARSVLTSR